MVYWLAWDSCLPHLVTFFERRVSDLFIILHPKWIFTQLEGCDPIFGFLLSLHDLATVNLNDRERMKLSPLVPDGCHAYFVSKKARSLRGLRWFNGLDGTQELFVHEILTIEIFDICFIHSNMNYYSRLLFLSFTDFFCKGWLRTSRYRSRVFVDDSLGSNQIDFFLWFERRIDSSSLKFEDMLLLHLSEFLVSETLIEIKILRLDVLIWMDRLLLDHSLTVSLCLDLTLRLWKFGRFLIRNGHTRASFPLPVLFEWFRPLTERTVE